MSKTLCRLVKKNVHREDPMRYRKRVLNPRYVCKRCGRVAAKAKYLCKPDLL